MAGEALKNEKAASVASQSPSEKQQRDGQVWRDWVSSYQQRLKQELAAGGSKEGRVALMNASNPKIVLRNWVAQVAIDAAAKGDYTTVCSDTIPPSAAAHGLFLEGDSSLCICMHAGVRTLSCRTWLPCLLPSCYCYCCCMLVLRNVQWEKGMQELHAICTCIA